MNAVTSTTTAVATSEVIPLPVQQLAPAVVVPPGGWGGRIPGRSPMRVPFGSPYVVPERDGRNHPLIPMQCRTRRCRRNSAT